MPWLWLSLVSVALWGLWGLLLKIALQGVSWPQLFVIGTLTSLPVTVIVVAVVRPALALSPDAIVPAIAAQLLGILGAIALYLALEHGGRASVVIPLTAAYPVLTAALSFAVLREEPEPTKLAAVALFVAATVLAVR